MASNPQPPLYESSLTKLSGFFNPYNESTLEATVVAGTLVYTNESSLYNSLEQWGYAQKTVCHSKEEYARDEDGDGFREAYLLSLIDDYCFIGQWLRAILQPAMGIMHARGPNPLVKT